MRGFEILKKARKHAKITQFDAAEEFGVNEKTYRHWENGDTPISYDNLIGMVESVFNLKVADFQHVNDNNSKTTNNE